MKSCHAIVRPGRAGFTLPETAMAIGIVATIALPVLAMLAGGGSLETAARDRLAASAIVNDLGRSFRTDAAGGLFVAGPRSELIAVSAGEATYLALDAEGVILRGLGDSEYRSGVNSEDAAFLLAIRSAEIPAGGIADRAPGLREIDLVVEQPAAAAADARSRDRFQSRILAR